MAKRCIGMECQPRDHHGIHISWCFFVQQRCDSLDDIQSGEHGKCVWRCKSFQPRSIQMVGIQRYSDFIIFLLRVRQANLFFCCCSLSKWLTWSSRLNVTKNLIKIYQDGTLHPLLPWCTCSAMRLPSIQISRHGTCPKSRLCLMYFILPEPSIPTSRHGTCPKLNKRQTC